MIESIDLLPQYTCSKIVRAFKIKPDIRFVEGETMLRIPGDGDGQEFAVTVPNGWGNCIPFGQSAYEGYFVSLEDGAVSWIPTTIFEMLFTLRAVRPAPATSFDLRVVDGGLDTE